MINEAVSAGARQSKACEVINITPRTLQNWRKRPNQGDLRRGPKHPPPHKISTEERAAVLAELNAPENSSLCPGQIVARIADEGRYLVSESSMYRILRKEKLLKHREPSAPPQERSRPEGVATHPNQLWAWDITYLPTQVRGRFVYLYTCMDVFSRKIVGWRVEEEESGAHAAQLMEECILTEEAAGCGLCLHSDNGAPMTSSTLKATLERLKVATSLSRPGVSDDNAFPESLFRTLKYRPSYPKSHLDLDGWRLWVKRFVKWYNEVHRHSGISYVTPSQRHLGLDVEILMKRREVYGAARTRNPRRWSRSVRSWDYLTEVRLAPLIVA
jgi:transposase InsO family protein